MNSLIKLLSTLSSSSTSASESDGKSVKEKGSYFKVSIHLTVLNDPNRRSIQDSRKHLSWTALRKYIIVDKLFILDVCQNPGYDSVHAVTVKNLDY